MVCPDSECHDNLSRIGKCTEEIKKMLPTYLTKSTAKWFIGMLLTIALVFALAWGDTRSQVIKNTTNYEHLVNTIEKMPTKGDIYRIVNKKLSAEEKRKMMDE